jgi:hypothetical protein
MLQLVLAFLAVCISPAFSQQPSADNDGLPSKSDELLHYLRENALSVNIVARVNEPGAENIWRTESKKVTISGRAVQVRLSGENLIIFADIIPYMNEDRTILLVAKGEVWAQSDSSSGVKYYSTMKSLPVRAGESVIFFPLGRAMDQQQNIYTIELEISVIPYTP